MHFLGLDIGTSAVKAVLVDERQTIVAQASAPVATLQPRPGWSEQDPEDWWRATLAAVSELRGSDAFPDVRAIGLSGQMHGAVVLDAAGSPIRPAMIWNDGRAVAECAELVAAVPDIASIAGVPPMPGFTAPKLMWLRKHAPADFARIRHVMLAKDYVRLKLTGEYATDMVDAAGTLMLDEAQRDWAAGIVSAVGIAPAYLPRLLEGPQPSGTLRPAIAQEWGLPPSVMVAAGAGDAAAGAIGIGAIGDGDGFLSLGTSAQIFVSRTRYEPKPGTLIHAFAHALPGLWFEQAAMLNGAAPLEWLLRLLGQDAAIVDRLVDKFTSLSPVVFLPYLAGERTPLNDPNARGAFFGLEYATSPDDLAQAVLEGVATSLMLGQEAFGEVRRSPLAVVGGGARSAFWLRLIASALGRPLLRVAGGDNVAAFGAARLARLAATGEHSDRVCVKPTVVDRIEPDGAIGGAFTARLALFRRLYQAGRNARLPPQ